MNGRHQRQLGHGDRDRLPEPPWVYGPGLANLIGSPKGAAEGSAEYASGGSPPGGPGSQAGLGLANMSGGTAASPTAPAALIREGAALKAEIDDKTARLRRINLALAECARFKGGQKTAIIFGAGYKVKVRLHEIIAWDQDKILKFRDYLPDEKFSQLFKAVYEPTSKKEIDGFIAHADEDLSNGLKWCMSVKPGAPQVTYEKTGDG